MTGSQLSVNHRYSYNNPTSCLKKISIVSKERKNIENISKILKKDHLQLKYWQRSWSFQGFRQHESFKCDHLKKGNISFWSTLAHWKQK